MTFERGGGGGAATNAAVVVINSHYRNDVFVAIIYRSHYFSVFFC